MSSNIVIRHLGRTEFENTWRAMQDFTTNRAAETPDEIWLTEHSPVYTLGLNRKNVRMPSRDDIPVVNTDRGGKITFHGPGQIIIYFLIDLKRKGINIRQLVSAMENAVIALLKESNVDAAAKADAPGVYVQEKKIASLGLRLKKECCYHGLSLNVDMDLSPFNAIDPCGYQGLEVTQLKSLGVDLTQTEAATKLLKYLIKELGYSISI
ncbi:lipoyl(octanoyl) transferase LipB [Candidatus Methylopumilus turicensis]|uniref:Octanoyltransferase n=1 Tax=Candidatus Methylopumilus turicensis TaxID=1581680 RepID=A0A0B7IWS7_9PROT|nr:lipoyl(octanoyl) transferase LipB [Candidatus Methylopumilus turicensis]CEN56757.1 lipoyl-protein ligase [Candidatus Methylopumilus turicensis]